MYKNRIGGRHDGTSEHEVTKSISIKRRGCKFGGRASKDAKLTSGGLRRVAEPPLRESRGSLTAAQKSAEGVVVRKVWMKARTIRSGK
jgi:hypothetical protein